MNDQETIRTLAMLRYADGEAVRMFDLAFPQFVDLPEAQQLQRFRDDHQRHVERIDGALTDFGSQDAEAPHEYMALVQEHFGMLDDAPDNDAALEALLLAERAMLAEYEQAAGYETSESTGRMLREHHADEQRHVDYLEQRVPMKAGAATIGARSGVTTSPPQPAGSDRGVGTGGSLGGMGSGAAPRVKERRGQTCPPRKDR